MAKVIIKHLVLTDEETKWLQNPAKTCPKVRRNLSRTAASAAIHSQG